MAEKRRAEDGTALHLSIVAELEEICNNVQVLHKFAETSLKRLANETDRPLFCLRLAYRFPMSVETRASVLQSCLVRCPATENEKKDFLALPVQAAADLLAQIQSGKEIDKFMAGVEWLRANIDQIAESDRILDTVQFKLMTESELVRCKEEIEKDGRWLAVCLNAHIIEARFQSDFCLNSEWNHEKGKKISEASLDRYLPDNLHQSASLIRQEENRRKDKTTTMQEDRTGVFRQDSYKSEFDDSCWCQCEEHTTTAATTESDKNESRGDKKNVINMTLQDDAGRPFDYSGPFPPPRSVFIPSPTECRGKGTQHPSRNMT